MSALRAGTFHNVRRGVRAPSSKRTRSQGPVLHEDLMRISVGSDH